MIPISISISRRILQAADMDAFNSIPETSLSPPPAAVGPSTTPASSIRRPFVPSTPFDSSMALTILVLLTALFFLGFFSVYIRRFSDDAEAATPPSAPLNRPPPSKSKGLDASAVNSLPLVAYGRAAKHPMIDDCPICLNEFHERETVKLIPYCRHVFHPSCVDTWLASHVTCPLCRSAELFKRVEEVCLDVAADKNDKRAPEIGERSTVENCDTWSHRSSAGVRRTCSSSDMGNQVVLQRSTSF